uniref:Protein ycf2 n=1 Tax=Lygus hesperus TaxID=30085 RepID=A0A0A9WT94_LYGHE
MDFYVYSIARGKNTDDLGKPYHTGVACLHPCTISDPEGIVRTDILDIRGNNVGEITLRYVLIRNVKQIKYRLNHSLAILWESMWYSTSRGCLNVIRTCSETRDNTVASVEETRPKDSTL